jgi:hypothetical protein
MTIGSGEPLHSVSLFGGLSQRYGADETLSNMQCHMRKSLDPDFLLIWFSGPLT